MTENSKPSLVEMKSEMSAMKKELEETKQLLLQMMKTSPFLPENQAKLMGSLQNAVTVLGKTHDSVEKISSSITNEKE